MCDKKIKFRNRYIIKVILTLLLLIFTALMFTGCEIDKEVVENLIEKNLIEKNQSSSNMEYTITLKEWNENKHEWDEVQRIGNYRGELVNGIPEGEGIFSAANGQGINWSYTGNFSNGTFSGHGKVVWDDGSFQEGTYTEGAFTPRVDELFCAIGTRSIAPFTITKNNQRFIYEHEDIFTNEKNYSGYDNIMSNDISFAIEDDLTDVEETLCYCTEALVDKIYINSMYGHTITFVLVRDRIGSLYILVYDGEINEIQEQMIVTFTGLPVDKSSFTNDLGTVYEGVVVIASEIRCIY